MSLSNENGLILPSGSSQNPIKSEIVNDSHLSSENVNDVSEMVAKKLGIEMSPKKTVIRTRSIRIGSEHSYQKYRKEWEQDTSFKDWLSPYPDDDSFAYCTVCDEKLRARIIVLKNHLKSAKHKGLVSKSLGDSVSHIIKNEGSEKLDSDFDEDDLDDIEPPRKKVRNHYSKVYKTSSNQRYKVAWEKDPVFKDWISSVPKQHQFANCKACNVTMKATYTKIKCHSKSSTHRRLMEIFESNPESLVDLPNEEEENKEDEPQSSEEEEEDNFGSDEDAQEAPVKKTQKFRSEWEKNPKYSLWLTPHPENEHLARCKVCNTEFMARLCVINKHMEAIKHRRIMSRLGVKTEPKEPQKQPIITPAPRYHLVRLPQDHEAVKNAEAKLCAFLDKYNASDTTVSHMEFILKACFPDSSVAKVMSLRRARKAMARKDVPIESEVEVKESPKRINFSVAPFGMADITTVEPDSIVVTYTDTPDSQLQDVHLSML